MGKFNWAELKALVVSIVENLAKTPPPNATEGWWEEGWVSASVVRETMLGKWGPQMDEPEFYVLCEELVADGALEPTNWQIPGPTGWSLVWCLRPPRAPRTERVPTDAPPG